MDKLSRYKKSLEEVDLREKQLAAMRIDICNAENLRKLKGARFRLSAFTLHPTVTSPVCYTRPPSR